ncbi:eCIS core domain-containing protein [Cellulomonas sp. McL0617]|uniref:eCIS core domain-containing protein n=1 Tax=Cellulomonas sp. McL0617 TaxID=3415675 RepID=UPI003CEF4F95
MSDDGSTHVPAVAPSPAPAAQVAVAPAATAGAAAVGVSGLTLRRAGAGTDVLGGTEAPTDTAEVLARRSGGGSPLPGQVATSFGDAMGADLSAVRIHTDPEADQISRSLQATAFTHGNDVYFTQGAYSPGTSGGQHLLAHELAHVAQQETGVQRSVSGQGPVIGLAADPAEAQADAIADTTLARLRLHASEAGPEVAPVRGRGLDPLRRHAALGTGSAVLRRKIVKMGKGDTESVDVKDDVEEAEARKILEELATRYGIDLSSPTAVTAIRALYTPWVTAEVLAQVSTSTWQLKELRALHAAAVHLGPLLGQQRAKNPALGAKAQGVTTIGRVKSSITPGQPVDQTMGEYFPAHSNVALTDTVTDMTDDRYVKEGATAADNKTTLEANAIHEMSHAVVEPLLIDDWVTGLEYWTDKTSASGKASAEDPPTAYAHTNAAEDLAESVALYFVNRPKLKAACPKREAILAAAMAKWTPEVTTKVVDTAASGTGSEPAPTGVKELTGAVK